MMFDFLVHVVVVLVVVECVHMSRRRWHSVGSAITVARQIKKSISEIHIYLFIFIILPVFMICDRTIYRYSFPDVASD